MDYYERRILYVKEIDRPLDSLKELFGYEELANLPRLWTRKEILASPCPVPREPGVYAWFFRQLPPGVPTDGCLELNGLRLLYVGISPKAPPKNGRPPSRQTLVDRLRFHMKGHAEGSTFRLSLGCLLSETLSIKLRRIGSARRLTFADGEERLSNWMSENVFVTWHVHPEPWVLE